MKRALGRVITCLLLSSAVTACGSDDSGSGGGTGGATGGSGGATGGSGGATGGSGGTGTGGVSGSATGGSAGQVPCTLTLSGASTGTADCTDSASSEFIGIPTGTTVTWMVSGETADAKGTFSFNLAKPPLPMTYVGTAADELSCSAQVITKDFQSNWTANSKSPGPGASCSITLDSVVENSSGSTTRFVVHGTATATVVKASDQSTVDVNVTF